MNEKQTVPDMCRDTEQLQEFLAAFDRYEAEQEVYKPSPNPQAGFLYTAAELAVIFFLILAGLAVATFLS